MQESCHSAEMLSVLWGRGLCVCAFGVSMLWALVCVGWRVRGCVCCEGSGAVCLKVPKGTWLSSCPFTLSWKNCIHSIWGRETSPLGNGAKGGKTYDTAIQVQHTSAKVDPANKKICEYKVVSSCFINSNESKLTKSTDELSLNCPGDCLDQGGRGETSKQHVIQEDNVEVPKPVVPTKVSQ